MRLLIKTADAIDALTRLVGQGVAWLTLLLVLLSSGNAIIRKLGGQVSNAPLEGQWYLFSAVFLLGSAYVLQTSGHVRIDVLYSRWSRRTQLWIDIVATVLFLLPLCWLMVRYSWPIFIESFVTGERSSDAGGLIRWPVKLLVPVGFSLLALQGLSEIIKRVAELKGLIEEAV
ncbi:TRAP transporter small permease subunit [Chitinibacteraceae bacterium HSL-7]